MSVRKIISASWLGLFVFSSQLLEVSIGIAGDSMHEIKSAETDATRALKAQYDTLKKKKEKIDDKIQSFQNIQRLAFGPVSADVFSLLIGDLVDQGRVLEALPSAQLPAEDRLMTVLRQRINDLVTKSYDEREEFMTEVHAYAADVLRDDYHDFIEWIIEDPERRAFYGINLNSLIRARSDKWFVYLFDKTHDQINSTYSLLSYASVHGTGTMVRRILSAKKEKKIGDVTFSHSMINSDQIREVILDSKVLDRNKLIIIEYILLNEPENMMEANVKQLIWLLCKTSG